MSKEKIKDFMEEKIVMAFKEAAASAMASDITLMEKGGFDPQVLEKICDFAMLLCECGEKRLYNSRENALKTIREKFLR